jgi:hypothetical protein
MNIRARVLTYILIPAVLLTAYVPLHAAAGSPPADPSEIAGQVASHPVLEPATRACTPMVDPGQPLPCPCDAPLASGCGSDRVSPDKISLVDWLTPYRSEPFRIESLHTLCDPQLPHPPPQRIS